MTCSIRDCPKRVLARGWCSTHYQRWYKTGQLSIRSQRPIRICKNGHRFTKSNTYVYPSGKRSCRVCRAWFKRTYRQRAKAQGRKLWQSSNEYKREWEREVREGLRTPQPIKKRHWLSREIVDLLQIEGSWWNAVEITHRLKAHPDSVTRALVRLTREGALVSRPIAGSRSFEWRAT